MNLANTANEGDNLDAVRFLQILFGERTRSNSANGLSGRTPTTTRARFEVVLFEIGKVGMGGTRVSIEGVIGVIVWSLILVADKHSDGSAEGDAELGAGLDLDLVLLISRCCDRGLTGSSSSHLGLDVGLGE